MSEESSLLVWQEGWRLPRVCSHRDVTLSLRIAAYPFVVCRILVKRSHYLGTFLKCSVHLQLQKRNFAEY